MSHDSGESDVSDDEQPASSLEGSDTEEPELVDPDAVVVHLPGGRAIVFAEQSEITLARWGRSLPALSRRELKAALRCLDPVARAVIEAKRLTGSLVELHPKDRELFRSGAQAFRESGGWLQANFRDEGRYVRLMRIRPASNAAVMSNGMLVLGAIAAQAEAAELAHDIKALGMKVDQLYKHLQDDQVGAVEHVIEQVSGLLEMLRAHGVDGVSDSDVAVIGNELGQTRHACLQHLKTAVGRLDAPGHSTEARSTEAATMEAIDDALLYLTLAGRIEVAMIQFGFVQAAYDFHLGKHDVAKTRVDRHASAVAEFHREIATVREHLSAVEEAALGHLMPWWRIAGREIGASAGKGLAGGAGGGALLAAAPVAAAVQDGDSEVDIDLKKVGGAAAVVGAVGLVGGVIHGAKNTVSAVREGKSLKGRLSELSEASAVALEQSDEATASLARLQALPTELVSAAD